MALVLDATPAGAAANAYCTAAEGDAYHASRGFNTEWTAALTGAKELAIVWATRQLDQMEWKGSNRHPYASGQALRFPRAGLVDRDFVRIDPDVIPQWLKNATAEWAFYLLKDDRTDDAGGLVPQDVKIGSLSISGLRRNPIPASVLEIISPWLAYASGELVRS